MGGGSLSKSLHFTAEGKEIWQSHAMVLKVLIGKLKALFPLILHALKQVT